MGGQGSGRRPSEATIVKRMCEPKTPITSDGVVGDSYLPNHSGIASHPEALGNFLKLDGSNANQNIDIGDYSLIATALQTKEGLYNLDNSVNSFQLRRGLFNQFSTNVDGYDQTIIGMQNIFTISGLYDADGSAGYGSLTRLSDGNYDRNQTLVGHRTDFNILQPSVRMQGSFISTGTATINNPTQDQIADYVNMALQGTDTGMHRWAYYNNSTNSTAGKRFLGRDNVKQYLGTGYDVSYSFDGSKLNFKLDEFGSNSATFGDGGTTNYTEIKSDGEINLYGTARVLKRLQIVVGSFRAPGTGGATSVDYGLNGAYSFSKSVTNAVADAQAVPFDLDRSVAPVFTIGWTGGAETTGTCVWQLEVLYRAEDEDWSSTTPDQTIEVEASPSTTANGLTLTSFTLPTLSSTDAGMIFRLSRLGADADDDMDGVAYLIGGALDYTSNKLGEAL